MTGILQVDKQVMVDVAKQTKNMVHERVWTPVRQRVDIDVWSQVQQIETHITAQLQAELEKP